MENRRIHITPKGLQIQKLKTKQNVLQLHTMSARRNRTIGSQLPALVSEVRLYIKPTILEGQTDARFISLSERMFLITVC